MSSPQPLMQEMESQQQWLMTRMRRLLRRHCWWPIEWSGGSFEPGRDGYEMVTQSEEGTCLRQMSSS
jgi:hypothetical protein